ncbi:transposable element Tcb1 transposase [Trichonephila clavipes]|uniref:Transposable element Tcb1 transposase n=1 Tax=Trichonephila clavipes TaxID=2585209 RepID=A0A8X7BJM6_TRICX|nr:transposable element Tcb1 transposase [Trichonephila clavipes]
MLNSCVMHRLTCPAPGIMVWGGIGYHSHTPLVRIDGTLNSQRYISEVLEPVVLPYLQGLPTAIFQQDDTRPHVARIVQRFFVNHQIELLSWPARSPDLSPIENMLSMVAQRLTQITLPAATPDQLWQRVEAAWLLYLNNISKVSESMPRHVAANSEQQRICQDSAKYASLDLNLEIKLTISFAPNNDTKDNQSSKNRNWCGHTLSHPPESNSHQYHQHMGGHLGRGSRHSSQSSFMEHIQASVCNERNPFSNHDSTTSVTLSFNYDVLIVCTCLKGCTRSYKGPHAAPRATDFRPPVLCCQVIYSQFGLAIHQNDHQARRRFVEWAQNEIAVVPDFHKRILFSDEAHFWLNGYVHKQNCRIWSEANPQVYVETPLHPEKLTVWCALWAGGILLQKDEGHNVTVNGDR